MGHLATDINQGALPAMLPFFIAAYDLSYAAAAGIVFAANMTSSIVQPLFGHAADRFSKRWLLPVGLILAVLLQVRGGGLGGIFGQADTVYRTKRGVEKTLFQLTVATVVLFIAISLVRLKLGA